MTGILIILAVLAALVTLVVICDMAIIVKKKRDMVIQRGEFYAGYVPPSGRQAVIDRKHVAEAIKNDPDEPPMNRKQRLAMAGKVQKEMAKKARMVKRSLSEGQKAANEC